VILPSDDRTDGNLRVSVVVPVRNEELRVPAILCAIEAQSLAPQEVIFVDGGSTDGTRQWLEVAKSCRPWMSVLDNPDQVIPAALNRAAASLDCDVIARMDAHVDYPSKYLESLVDVLRENPHVAGVGAPYETRGEGTWGEAIAAVLRRPWGHGGAGHQSGTKPGPINHTRWTAYRLPAVQAAGGWDRQMLVNEDEEMDFRVREWGPIWLVPTVKSVWYVRNSPKALVRQMWRYGYFRAVTLRLHPETLNTRVLAPPMLALLMAGMTVLSPKQGVRLSAGYLATAGLLGAASAHQDGASAWRGATVLPIVHLVYGCGFVVGWLTNKDRLPMLDWSKADSPGG
jgi:succinoglycan biosynthesis protein ExoA